MSTALRPVLRPSAIQSPPTLFPSTTYICQPCRNARLLKRPKRPYTFTQLVTLSDGSAFLQRTCSPLPVYRSTRDTRNAPLWNPSSQELLNVEDDEAGRLAGFRARFGTSFDTKKAAATPKTTTTAPTPVAADAKPTGGAAADVQETQAKGKDAAPFSPAKGLDSATIVDLTETQGKRGDQKAGEQKPATPAAQVEQPEEDDGWDFGDDDANLLDLISSFGQEDLKIKDTQVVKKNGSSGKK